jgi:hypothetical protein
MSVEMAVVFRYWVSTDSPAGFPDLAGIEEFRNELDPHYATLVRGRPAGAGGPVYVIVQVIAGLSWSHLVQLLVDGAAYDLITKGAKSFVLRPFIAAYKRLRERNRERQIDLNELRIEFEDCDLIIHEVSSDTIIDNLEAILPAVARHYSRLAIREGVNADEIHIPVIEDPDARREARFRVLSHVDEPITGKGPEDYQGYWGVIFDHEHLAKVYDVKQKILLNDRFLTESEYWQELSRRVEAR